MTTNESTRESGQESDDQGDNHTTRRDALRLLGGGLALSSISGSARAAETDGVQLGEPGPGLATFFVGERYDGGAHVDLRGGGPWIMGSACDGGAESRVAVYTDGEYVDVEIRHRDAEEASPYDRARASVGLPPQAARDLATALREDATSAGDYVSDEHISDGESGDASGAGGCVRWDTGGDATAISLSVGHKTVVSLGVGVGDVDVFSEVSPALARQVADALDRAADSDLAALADRGWEVER